MKWSGQKQYEQPPAGSHLARCVSIVDLGSQLHTYQDKQEMSRDVRITFELPSLLMEGKFDPKDKGRAHGVSRTVKMSLHPKATLRKLLEGWRGKKFASKEEIDAFDPKKLIGHPARLTLVEDGDYVNLESISPINPKTDKVPKQIAKSTFFSLEPDEFDLEVFGSLGEATKEKIKKSPEYAAIAEGQAGGGELAETHEGDGGEGGEGGEDGSDDAPF